MSAGNPVQPPGTLHLPLHRLQAGELAAGIAGGQVSAREVMEALLERVSKVNPAVNALVTLNPRALEEADACDARLARGGHPRPLEGVPVVIKDILPTRGLRTTWGSTLRRDFVPDEDALAVTRLVEAGAIVLGKTNTPEFAHDVNTNNKIFGVTRNPWNLRHSAGGSSGGTAAALAAGMAPAGLGTDLGGSIRIPSALCGTVGIRSAPGRVPTYPAEFGWDTLVQHVTGPMTRSVADTGLLLSVLAGPDDRDPASLPLERHDYRRSASGQVPVTGRRVAFSTDLGGLLPVDDEVAAAVREAARAFELQGCPVEEACFDPAGLREIVSGTRGFGMVGRYADLFDAHQDEMTPALFNQVSASLKLDLRTVTRAERMRTDYWHRVRTFLERYEHLILPACGAPALRLDEPLPDTVGGKPVESYYDVFLFNYAISITALPVVAVPCGLTRAGLPMGIQIVSRRLREDAGLEAAAAYEQACPHAFAMPEIDLALAADLPAALDTPGLVVKHEL